MATKWLESIDLMNAEMSLAHLVMVVVVHVPLLDLQSRIVCQMRVTPVMLQDSVPGAALASRLVRELPAQYGRLVLVTSHKGLDVGLERRLVDHFGSIFTSRVAEKSPLTITLAFV